jgi:hypothetical protein
MKSSTCRFVCALAWLLSGSAATAQTIVDQEFSGGFSASYYLDFAGDFMAQTFTMRNGGQIMEIGVRVVLSHSFQPILPPSDDLTMQLLRTDASGAPNAAAMLATRDFSWQEVQSSFDAGEPYVPFDVSAWNVHVSAGDVLAIALSSDQTAYDSAGNYLSGRRNYDWSTAFNDPFPGGEFWLYSPQLWGPVPWKFSDRLPNPTRDMGFRVIVALPEPTGAALAGCGVMSLAALRRRMAGRPFAASMRYRFESLG